MNKTIRILGVLALVCIFSAFSCAGKKGDMADKGDMVTEEEAPSEAEGMESAEGAAEMTSLDQLQRVYFDFDDATLRSEAREALKTNAEILSKNPQTKISIEGHCDERGSVEYNLALGERRAESIKRYLSNLGISNSRMSTISYGEEKPLVFGHNEDAWAKNRRGELVPR